MPLINPGSQDNLPQIVYDEIAPALTSEQFKRIEEYLNVPNWVCPCGMTMMGRVRACTVCKKER